MALGIMQNDGSNITGFSSAVQPDKSLSRKNTPRVHLAQFGDGYEQRARKGLNSLTEVFAVSFENRTLQEANELVEFFDIVLGVTAFEFTLPGSSLANYDTCLVVCDDYNRTFTYNNYNTVTATFRKVYDSTVGGVTFGDGANNVGVGVTPVGTSVAGGGGGGY